ncbi:MAG TPA: hypothetical protein VIJ93_09985, partial [bacterium]
FQVRKFTVLGRYEIHFGRDEKTFFYEIEDLETFATVDVKDGLTEGEFLEAVGSAMNPMEFFVFQKLIHSIT